MQVSKDRFNFIKLKINEKKDLATMIGNKRYTLNDVNELVIKIAEQKVGKNNAIKAYNNLVDKAKKIANLRSTPHRFKLDLTDKLNLKNPNENMALANLSIYYTWKNIKSEYKNNKFKISAPTWNDTFELPDGSYSIADTQDYFEFIIKKRETLT